MYNSKCDLGKILNTTTKTILISSVEEMRDTLSCCFGAADGIQMIMAMIKFGILKT